MRNHSAWVLSWVRKFYDWHLPNGDLTAYAEQLPGVVTRNQTQCPWLEPPVLCHRATTTRKPQSCITLFFLLGRQIYGLSLDQLNTVNFFPPVNCRTPPNPQNGMIKNISTVEVVFRCNPGFVLAGRMNATCVSPDGISAVGTWIPDPADFVCNGETQES